jgi:hypothetical protein
MSPVARHHLRWLTQELLQLKKGKFNIITPTYTNVDA